MVADDHGDLVCGDGCGTWVARAALEKLIGSANLPSTRIPYWKATPLPETHCLVCRSRLDDVYAELGHRILAFGKCVEHGVWIEGGTRAELEAAYAAEIERHARTPAPRPAPPPPDHERIAALEARVEKLEKMVSVLVERVPSRWFDD